MELAKVKKRREERETEKEMWEEERDRQQREESMAQFGEWEQKEDKFHLEQSLLRSEIRIKQGRAKPIDLLYMNLKLHPDFEFNMNEPYKICEDLSLQQLQELRKDIEVFLSLDSHKTFWEAMLVVCNDEISKKPPEAQDATVVRPVESALHQAVSSDVDSVFASKTSAELETMQNEIMKKAEGKNAVDVEYWEALLRKIRVVKAKVLHSVVFILTLIDNPP